MERELTGIFSIVASIIILLTVYGNKDKRFKLIEGKKDFHGYLKTYSGLVYFLLALITGLYLLFF
ncbi:MULTISPECIES: hypothetical protein [unclassified Lentimicrobium]|uniref:hypothetical protein n=1 Tax=unclassified Lentimicrobium TaxID=2677434 RepID=UPI00155682B8|nr:MULTISPECIES: hypothetical protein [unclassified Lentimicrobium]NPD45275.1 hypothetical protein [Lentimicrobium sp. S6]NPD86225.1 hypothetical protein [Lentimicrobium sp. L6]